MSFEAVAFARKIGSTASHEQKWLTVPTDNREAAHDEFRKLGYEVRGLTILTQEEATEAAQRI